MKDTKNAFPVNLGTRFYLFQKDLSPQRGEHKAAHECRRVRLSRAGGGAAARERGAQREHRVRFVDVCGREALVRGAAHEAHEQLSLIHI